jgi:F-type H+-transporting ATPase subunit alpha
VTVAKQVCAIYAGSKGHLDTIEVSKVKKFEKDLYLMLEEEKSILEAITKDKEMKEDTENKLVALIQKVIELNK